MNKIIVYASLALLAFNFTSCRNCEDKYLKKANPDAGYQIFLNKDSANAINPKTDTIFVTDMVTFVSTANHDLKSGLEEKYVLYTGYGSCQYGSYSVAVNDSVSETKSHGVAISLTKSNGKYSYKNYSFKVAGEYRLYYVATINAKDGGCYENVIDSSVVVTVYDRNSRLAKVTKMMVKAAATDSKHVEGQAGGWKKSSFDSTTAVISDADAKITISSTSTSEMSALRNNTYYFLLNFTASSNKIWIDGVAMVYNPTRVIKFVDGSKLRIVSPNGEREFTYTISLVDAPKSSAVEFDSVYAVAYNSSAFQFQSLKATIDTNSKNITLPALPAGTNSITLVVKYKGITKRDSIKISSFPKNYDFTAPNGVDKYTYKVQTPTLFQAAIFSDVTLKSPSGMASQKLTPNKYVIYPVLNSATDTTFKLVFAIGGMQSYSKTYYTASLSEKAYKRVDLGLKDTVVWTTSMSTSIPFKIINGGDTSKFEVLVKTEKIY